MEQNAVIEVAARLAREGQSDEQIKLTVQSLDRALPRPSLPLEDRELLRDLAADLEDLVDSYRVTELPLPSWILEDVKNLRRIAGLGK